MDPDTGEPTGVEYTVKDTPLLINIKGCGYPPEVNCDTYAEKYFNHSMVQKYLMLVVSNKLIINFQDKTTFPCHYSAMNPWIVISSYDRSHFVIFHKHL